MEKSYTREDIEELKRVREENPELLSPYERGLANLKPIKKGEVRGSHKGVPNWSSHFKKLMGDEKFFKTIISANPKDWNNVVEEFPADFIAAGVIATTIRSVGEAVANKRPLDKNTIKSIELINKLGWGEKSIVSVDEEQDFFSKAEIVFNVVSGRKQDNSDS